jgi:hypothetical protein
MTTVLPIDLLSSLDTVLLPDPGAPDIWMKSFCVNCCFFFRGHLVCCTVYFEQE